MSFAFTPINSPKLDEWIEEILELYDQDTADRIFTNALNIGRLAIKTGALSSSEHEGIGIIKDLIETEISSIRDTVTDSIESTLVNKNASVIDQVQTLITEIKSLGILSEGSSKKGLAIEKIVLKNLQNYIPEWQFTSSGRETSSCDIIAKKGNISIAVEIKNYNTSVPKKEVDKFYKDLSATNVDAGLFLSTSSSIVDHEDFEITSKFFSKTIPIVFLGNCGVTSSPYVGFIMLTMLCEKQIPIKELRSVGMDDGSILTKLKKELIESTHRLSQIEKDLSTSRNEYSDMRKKIVDLLDNHNKSIITVELSLKHELRIVKNNFEDLTLDKFYTDPINSDLIKFKNYDEFNTFIEKKDKNKKIAYNYLWEACAVCKEKESISQIIIRICHNGMGIVLRRNKQLFATIQEKSTSVQMNYTNQIDEGYSITYPYEIVNQSGTAYFNLSKIKNNEGLQILIAKLLF